MLVVWWSLYICTSCASKFLLLLLHLAVTWSWKLPGTYYSLSNFNELSALSIHEIKWHDTLLTWRSLNQLFEACLSTPENSQRTALAHLEDIYLCNTSAHNLKLSHGLDYITGHWKKVSASFTHKAHNESLQSWWAWLYSFYSFTSKLNICLLPFFFASVSF